MYEDEHPPLNAALPLLDLGAFGSSNVVSLCLYEDSHGTAGQCIRGQSIFMAILAADITFAISAALPDQAAGIPPFSPNPPVRYGKIAKKRFSLRLCEASRGTAVQLYLLSFLCGKKMH